MTLSLLIAAFGAILVLIAAATLIASLAGWLRRRHNADRPDPVIADSRDQFDPK